MAAFDDRPSDSNDRSCASFDDLYREEYRAVLAVAYALSGSPGAAEELTQEAFIALLRSWGRVSTYRDPAIWLRRVVVNLSVSRFRRSMAERRALTRLAGRRELPAALPDSDAAFWKLARTLPRRQAQVVVLHYLDDRPIDEIAEIVGCAPATVKVHLHRARQTLAQRLGCEFEEESNG